MSLDTGKPRQAAGNADRSAPIGAKCIAPGRLARTLQKVEAFRSEGITLTESETHEGFFGISAPVFGSGNVLCAAVTALGLSADVDLKPTGPVAVAIRDAARRISRDLGGNMPDLVPPAPVGGSK